MDPPDSLSRWKETGISLAGALKQSPDGVFYRILRHRDGSWGAIVYDGACEEEREERERSPWLQSHGAALGWVDQQA